MDAIGQGKWGRIAVLSASIAGLIAIALVAPLIMHAVQEHRQRIAARPDPVPASDLEQRQIVRAVLEGGAGLLVAPGERRKVILLKATVSLCGLNHGSNEATTRCATRPSVDSIAATDFDTDIPRKLRLQLIAANHHPVSVPDPQLPWVIYSPYPSKHEALKGTDPWGNFYVMFPGSGGLVEVSRAVLSHDKRHALIYMGHYAHGLAGRGSLHYLVRTGDTWLVSKSVGVWVS